MRRRWIILGGLLLLVLVAGLAVLSGWLLNTEAGLRFVLGRLESLSAVSITTQGARGTIGGPLSFDSVVIDHEAVRIEARAVNLEPRLASLVSQTIALARVSAGAVTVTLKDREPQSPSQPHFMPGFLSLDVRDLDLHNVDLALANGQRVAVAEVTGPVEIDRWTLTLPGFSLADPAGRLAGDLRVRATRPLGLRGRIAGHWRLPDDRDYRFAGEVRGNLDRLATSVSLTQPARLSFDGNALDLTDAPRLVGTLRAIGFDGSPWVPQGRFPKASGSVAVDAGRNAIGIDGTLTSEILGAEPLRVQGGGTWKDKAIEISSLRAWLPRSGALFTTSGTIDLATESPVLALSGEWSKLRWPLTGDRVIDSALGAYRIGGSLPYAFEIKAETAGPQLPPAAWHATGLVDREELTIDAADAYVLGGRIRAAGRLRFVDDQPWRITADGRSLDVRALRPDLEGRINVEGSVEGQGFGAAAPWTARVRELSGTLMGRALSGNGEIAHRAGEFELRGVRVTNADSYARIDGRYGRTIDLEWNADLRTLALIAPDLTGQLVASGRAQGTREQPSIVAEAKLTALRYGDLVVGSAEADVDLDLGDQRESSIDLYARHAASGALLIDRLHLRAQGRAAEHELGLELVSSGDEQRRIAGFLARVTARGALDTDRRGWRGELIETEFVYPDGSATLLQPAALELSREAARAAPICLETGEARLCAEGEWHAKPESWRLIYSAQDWPLKRLLTSLLGWREFDGMLQASGWIGKEPGQDWLGGTTVLLDKATFDIPRNKFRTERVQLGGGRVDLYAEAEQIRSSIELSVGENTQIKGEAHAERLPGAPLVEYPVTGRIHGGSAAITSLPLLVPEIDRSAGSLDAELSIGGTLGQPRFNGEFAVRDGLFELYRTNFVLSDTQLSGRFTGDEFTFEGRGQTAGGAVTLDGRFRWPDGVMTGAMQLTGDRLLVADTPEYRIVASPDLTVTAGVEGYVVTGQVVIPSAHIAPRDLSTSVGTSPDERIVGIDTDDADPSTLERVRTRIDVVLGEDVRVDSFGLRARLGGAVTVLTQPRDVARGQGAINVIEGQYEAFGQDVRITRGRLSYTNTPLSQPTLDLVAERRIEAEDVTVAVNVRGQLDDPFISLTSTPAMSSNEALSYLLTGRSIDTLQSGEVQALDSAAESLAISGGGLLLGGVGSRLGLDEVTVESTGDNGAAVVLGKYLSPRLFVSYGISIAEAINTIKLRYTLNEKWSLKSEAGLDQSADIEYRIERR